ncbi:unnamed protein product, partial [Symbiodinium pilosum]
AKSHMGTMIKADTVRLKSAGDTIAPPDNCKTLRPCGDKPCTTSSQLLRIAAE